MSEVKAMSPEVTGQTQAHPSRLAQLAAKAKQFDVVVIGGGIIGAGIARDASLRGLKVALFEQSDFGSGTTSRSTRLIHGGLRYLEMFDFGLVRQDLKEREILLKLAPHLVRPLAFLVPMYKRSLFYQVKLRIGMWLYDWLSFDKSLPNHRFFNKQQTLEREPGLKAEGLNGASLYYDAQVELAERLCLENILDAQANGALTFNYVKVTDTIRENSQVKGVKVQDVLTNETAEVQARLVVNASGAWLDPLETHLTGQASRKVRTTKGIHFTAPTAPKNAIVLFAEKDDRLFFVIPWLGYAWVGTTDTDFNEDLDSVRATAEDVDYLRETVREIFPQADWDTVYYTNAGVRALTRTGKAGGKDESAVSRKHGLVDHAKTSNLEGYVSVVGGKITAYRDIAQEATDLVCQKLAHLTPTITNKRPLPGGNIDQPLEHFISHEQATGVKLGLSEAQVQHLVNTYGSRVAAIFDIIKSDAQWTTQLHPAYPEIKAQIKLAVVSENCLTLSDFMMRRTDLYFSPDQGRQAIEPVLEVLSALLGWSEAERQRQVARYEQELAWTQEWRANSTKLPQTDSAVAATNPTSNPTQTVSALV
jgi:glycerol-3-phosphate dehydrogenase